MSRTAHHNAPKRGKLVKLADRYTGWLGEGLVAQEGREFRKRLEHRSARRWGFFDTCKRLDDVLFGKDIPLPFERKDYVPAQPKLPPIRRIRAVPKL